MPGPGEPKRHIIFSGRIDPKRFTSPASGGTKLEILDRNRSEHSDRIKEKLVEVQSQSELSGQLPEGIIREESVYVEFISDFNVKLAFDSFEDGRSGKYHLLRSYQDGDQFKALVVLNQKGISAFIKKIEDYAVKNTKKGRPVNRPLFNNILDIRIATIKAFWNEPTQEFPRDEEEIWWEVWIRRENFEADDQEDAKVVTQLRSISASVGERRLLFPEHIVRLVKATPNKLSDSLLLLDNLAELRMAKDTAEFFTDLTGTAQREWLADLTSRTDSRVTDGAVAVCILDTGVNHGHPLLSSFLPPANMDSFNPSWGNEDGHPQGHGTQMAGLSLYGDLVIPLASRDRIQIFHVLESIKIINPAAPHTPDIYGQVTIECVSRATIIDPRRKRVFCMAVTSDDTRDGGKPSSWSTAIDKLVFGSSGTSLDKLIFLISGGNVDHDNPAEYPSKNITDSIHDPGQAFNAITVGGYTEKVTIDSVRFPNASALADVGGMAPSNSTSCAWNKWPIKPDVVFEAGNYANQNGSIIIPDSLQVLTTAKNFSLFPFIPFGDTSCATALAANFTARIYQQYPDIWPETVRGILVHSARWTSSMLGRRALQALTSNEKKLLLRSYGFGVPDFFRAVNSLNNSLTLVAERVIQPFFKEGTTIKTYQMHVFDLPWPVDVLRELGASEARLSVTLSYFIEPNPGSRYYSSKFHYQSHGLRFKIRRPLESLAEFERRINRAARDEDDEYEGTSDVDHWQIGEKLRNIGSIQKDVWHGTGAELASMSNIAIHPVNGWWRFRTKLKRFDLRVRYSLIMTIETDDENVDLYTPVYNQITVTV